VLCNEDGALVGVQLSAAPNGDVSVQSKIVIGADGVESQVGRWAGLDTVPRLRDMCSAVQYLMAGLDIDEGICDFYFGAQVAPGGYLWIFPKGKGMANVGIGIAGNRAGKITAQAFLDRFVEANFPTGSILGVVAGGIPLAGTLKQMVKDGLMLVGDAAHQAFPHTGGGIRYLRQVRWPEVAVDSEVTTTDRFLKGIHLYGTTALKRHVTVIPHQRASQRLTTRLGIAALRCSHIWMSSH
jgi:digeranylgeranylglycerophospholipid reductase